VGVASGAVVLVGIGGGDQLRFEAVGEPFVAARRLEAAAAGGEVWVCAETRRAAGDALRGDQERELPDRDGEPPLRALRILGVGGAQVITLRGGPAPERR
jgi:class 3 adenylate cyclase